MVSGAQTLYVNPGCLKYFSDMDSSPADNFFRI